MKLPMVDVTTIGTGGGSIAWIDPSGGLRVGPRSAGADRAHVLRPGGSNRRSPMPMSLSAACLPNYWAAR